MKNQPDAAGPAASIEELEVEFAELFAGGATIEELLHEHKEEHAREERKLERIG